MVSEAGYNFTPDSTPDFSPVAKEEQQSLIKVRESVSFAKDAFQRLLRNPLAVISAAVLLATLVFAFVVPEFYPYSYSEQIRGSENLAPMQYSETEQASIFAGEKIFPHYFGTDPLGRDYAIRVMTGTKISLIVGIGASLIVLVIGSLYGAVSGFSGGNTDTVMMRIIEILSSVPDMLIIVLLMVTLKQPLAKLADEIPQFAWIRTVGAPLVCIFIVFALLYWMNMARIVRGEVLSLKQSEFITAARVLGVKNSRIIFGHLLRNCIGTLIVATTLQIPSAIFTESFLSFLGIGVAAPLPSLGSLSKDALDGFQQYPYLLFIPAIILSVIILAFNVFGDGLRDAFDPKQKNN